VTAWIFMGSPAALTFVLKDEGFAQLYRITRRRP
jgi:hypothetical protein